MPFSLAPIGGSCRPNFFRFTRIKLSERGFKKKKLLGLFSKGLFRFCNPLIAEDTARHHDTTRWIFNYINCSLILRFSSRVNIIQKTRWILSAKVVLRKILKIKYPLFLRERYGKPSAVQWIKIGMFRKVMRVERNCRPNNNYSAFFQSDLLRQIE